MKQKTNFKKLLSNLSIYLILMVSIMFSAHAYTSPATINLLTAADYVILTKTGVTNVHTSAITGDVGSSPITAASMDNVFCSEITGTIYGANAAYTGSGDVTCFAGTPSDNTLVANAVLDMGTAYGDATSRAPDATELGAGDLSGLTLAPGVYKWSTDVVINTDVTLNGSNTSVWIFQISGDLTVAAGANVPAGIKVLLIGGALPQNIFWQVGASNFGATLGTYSTFNGNILSAKQVRINTGAILNGRALADTQVTLQSNTITIPTTGGGGGGGSTNSTITLATPGNNTFKNNITPTFIFKYIGNTTASCTLFVDSVGKGINASTVNNTNTAIVANSSLTQGNHNWNVNCTDSSGNVGSSIRLVKIDTTSPVVNLISPTNNTFSASIFTFNYTDALSSTSSCTLYVGGVSKGTNGSVANNTNTAITANSSLTQGSNSWYVNCTDLAGNIGNSSSRIVLTDSIYPTSLINNVNGVLNGIGTTNETLTINFTANDTNMVNWTLSVYNSTWGLLQNWSANTNNLSAFNVYTATSNGTYYINLTVRDNATNINTTSFTVYVDQSVPIITTFTLSDSSVYIGQTITWSCLATDSYTVVTTDVTGLDTSSAGTRTATCIATDGAGNTASATASYTVSHRATGGGSGSGGSSSATSDNSQSSSLSTMIEGKTNVEFNKATLPVTGVDIETSEKASNVKITETMLSTKPSDTPAPQAEYIYYYIQIDHTNLNNSIISSVKIRFKVAKSWIESNSIQLSQIRLYRYNQGWETLNTTMLSNDLTYYYFEATSPGLSLFAIGSENAAVTPPVVTPAVTPPVVVPQVTGNAASESWFKTSCGLVLALFVIIGLLIGGYFMFREPKNKNRRHRD